MKTIKDKVYVIQSVFLFISMIIGATLYFNNTFATTQRADEIEKKINEIKKDTTVKIAMVQNVLCEMAIEQKLKRAVKICTSNKTK